MQNLYIMSNENLDKIIKIFTVLGIIAFIIGFVNMWVFLAAFIFGSAAATVSLFKNY